MYWLGKRAIKPGLAATNYCSSHNPSHNPLDQVKTSELELDKAALEERKYKESGEFDVLQEELENLEDLVAR